MSDDKLRESEDKLAALQAGLAEKRKTMRPNECPGCGSFRLDGQPPYLHEPGCPIHDKFEFIWHGPERVK